MSDLRKKSNSSLTVSFKGAFIQFLLLFLVILLVLTPYTWCLLFDFLQLTHLLCFQLKKFYPHYTVFLSVRSMQVVLLSKLADFCKLTLKTQKYFFVDKLFQLFRILSCFISQFGMPFFALQWRYEVSAFNLAQLMVFFHCFFQIFYLLFKISHLVLHSFLQLINFVIDQAL